MSDVIHTTTLEVRRSVHTPDFPAPTWKVDPDLSAVEGVSPRYWKWDAVAERPIPMTQGERDAFDAAATEASRDAAVEQMDRDEDMLRALALVLLDAVNAQAALIASMLAGVAAAGSLAALKTQYAAIQAPPQRTAAQLRAAIRAKIGT